MPDRPRCTKAVIALAGFGTRRLPITKAIEKSLLPVGNRPIIDYIVDDCIAAGITDIIFVVSEQAQQIHAYYGHNQQLEEYLHRIGKTDELSGLQHISTKATFHFVVQKSGQSYGTSVPIWAAKDILEPNEPFLVLYGDNIFYNEDGNSSVAQFLSQADTLQAKTAMMGVEVPHELVSKYGIVASETRGNIEAYKHIVEKPRPEDAPSNLINAGCFLLNSDIMPFVAQSIEHSPQEECYLIDALNWYSEAGNDIAVLRTKGEWLDCGSVDGWLYANNRILGQK